jgi:hypothetical protein
MSEQEFMTHLMIELSRCQFVRVWRQNCGSVPVRDRTGKTVRVFHAGPPAGAPDIVGVTYPSGRMVGIEVKWGTGRVRNSQLSFQHMLESMGGLYFLARGGGDPLTSARDVAPRIVQYISDKR